MHTRGALRSQGLILTDFASAHLHQAPQLQQQQQQQMQMQMQQQQQQQQQQNSKTVKTSSLIAVAARGPEAKINTKFRNQ